MNAIVDFWIDVAILLVWICRQLAYHLLLLVVGLLLPLAIAFLVMMELFSMSSKHNWKFMLVPCGLIVCVAFWVWHFRVRYWLASRSWL